MKTLRRNLNSRLLFAAAVVATLAGVFFLKTLQNSQASHVPPVENPISVPGPADPIDLMHEEFPGDTNPK